MELVNQDLTERIIGCAIRVHKALGPGFLEKIYEEAFCVELAVKNSIVPAVSWILNH